MHSGMMHVSASFHLAVEPLIVTPASTGDIAVLMKALDENALDSAPVLNTLFISKGGRQGWVQKHQERFYTAYYNPTVGRLAYNMFNSKKEAFQKLKEELLKPYPIVEPSTGWLVGSDEAIEKAEEERRADIVYWSRQSVRRNGDANVLIKAFNENMIDSISDQNTINGDLLNKHFWGEKGRDGWVTHHPDDNQKYIMVYYKPDDSWRYGNSHQYREFASKTEAVEALIHELWPHFSMKKEKSPEEQEQDIINISSETLRGDGDVKALMKAFDENRIIDESFFLRKMFHGGMGHQGWVDSHPFQRGKYIMVYLHPHFGYQYRTFNSQNDAMQGLRQELWPYLALASQLKRSEELKKSNGWKDRLYDYLTLYSGK